MGQGERARHHLGRHAGAFVACGGVGLEQGVRAGGCDPRAVSVRASSGHAFYDQDGPKAEATRRKVYDMLAAERMAVQGFHYPFPLLGHIEKDGTGYRVVPAAWNPTI